MLRRRTPPPPLELIPAGEVDEALMRALGEELQARLGLGWRIGGVLPLDEAWRDGEAGRYRSVLLIHALLDRPVQDGAERTWRLAIADAALCAAEAGTVFGEAAGEEGCAVVGLAPLRRGSGADDDVLRARLLTEALHELGHLAGARHCRRASCVMYPSLDIADTDLKGSRFCEECARVLEKRGIRKT